LTSLKLTAPAKLNLFLAVTGARADGYHDLVSVAAQLTFGDTVTVEESEGGFSVACDHPEVPTDGRNLVIRAAEAFAAATGRTGGARFTIAKRIPTGAGLGGASSDAVAALIGLNRLAGDPLDSAGLLRAASAVGSDCALFLSSSPVIMRGRGERTEPLPKEAYSRFRGARVLLFKPAFPVPTPWAYGRLAAGAPGSYVGAPRAENLLRAWIGQTGAPVERLLFNSMERATFPKYVALPALLAELQRRFGLSARMSGSGSACFALLGEKASSAPVEAAIREAWGASAFILETRVA
jgi:4-diphosphocytidyl-2-C-methyl-D-erythritol kinase